LVWSDSPESTRSEGGSNPSPVPSGVLDAFIDTFPKNGFASRPENRPRDGLIDAIRLEQILDRGSVASSLEVLLGPVSEPHEIYAILARRDEQP
jgi:hypothetical protein